MGGLSSRDDVGLRVKVGVPRQHIRGVHRHRPGVLHRLHTACTGTPTRVEGMGLNSSSPAPSFGKPPWMVSSLALRGRRRHATMTDSAASIGSMIVPRELLRPFRFTAITGGVLVGVGSAVSPIGSLTSPIDALACNGGDVKDTVGAGWLVFLMAGVLERGGERRRLADDSVAAVAVPREGALATATPCAPAIPVARVRALDARVPVVIVAVAAAVTFAADAIVGTGGGSSSVAYSGTYTRRGRKCSCSSLDACRSFGSECIRRLQTSTDLQGSTPERLTTP
jgi:hypothetical protein